MKTFKQFQEEKKFGPDGKPISKKDDLLKRMSKGYDKNVKGQLKDLESKARKPTQSPDGSYEVKFKKDGTPYTKPSAPDAKTGSDRIDNKTGSNMRKTKGQTYTKVPKTNTKSKTYGSKKNYRSRTQSEINRDFNKGIDDPSLKQSRTNIKSKTVGKNTKDILKQSLGNKNKVKNPITKIGKKIPIKPTVYSKVANVAKSLGPKGRAVALGALAVGAIATAVANRKKKDKTGSYQFNINKPSPGQSYIKGIPKARVDKPDSAQVSKPRKGSWNDRQLKMTNEGVASLAIKGGSKLIPALMTGIGAAGTIMQTKKSSPKGPFADTPSAEELRKAKLTGKLIKPKEGEVTKQRELVSKAEKEITKPKKGEKKEASKTLKDFLKARKIEGRTMMKIKQDTDISKKGPGDQLPDARRDYLNKLLKNLRKEEVAIANSMGGGGIAGSVEAGDEPPVKKNKRGSGMKNRKKKKKTYAYGGRGSRKMWMT